MTPNPVIKGRHSFLDSFLLGLVLLLASSGLSAVSSPSLAAGSAPVISEIPHQSTFMNMPIGPLLYTVTDADTRPENLTVMVLSDDDTLIPSSRISQGRQNGSLTFTLFPEVNKTGSTTVRVIATDGVNTTTEIFRVTVNPILNPPSMSPIPDQSFPEDTEVVVPFVISDPDTPLDTLTLSVFSTDPQLLRIIQTGTGADRALHLAGVTNLAGSANLTISVSDGIGMESATFKVTVVPVNDAPVISPIADLNVLQASNVQRRNLFRVTDVDTPEIGLSILVQSGNPAIIPQESISLSDSGADETLDFTTLSNVVGVVELNVIASDGALTATQRFNVTVHEKLVVRVTDLKLVNGFLEANLISNLPGTWMVESSADFLSWKGFQFGIATNALHYRTPTAGEPKRFFRLRVRPEEGLGWNP